MINQTYFRPAGAWAGDVIPYGEDDELSLFYLLERRVDPKPGTPWSLVTTRDGVHLDDRGVALPEGGAGDGDFNKYTGSVVRDALGIHHVFYTGQNPDVCGTDGRPLQLVMHAISTDGMVTWTSLPEDTFGATEGYETGDWRDPFVFADPDGFGWRMLVTARHRVGPARRRGLIAQLRSEDLRTWTPMAPLWDPRRYVAHECPEVFRIGDWWYLVYSEFSDAFVTRYRMARSLEGPWIAPEHDSLDGRAFYAAKSADLRGRRLFFGWISSREGSRDDGAWQWAGQLAASEATQRHDGALDFRIIPEQLHLFDVPVSDRSAIPVVASLRSADGHAAVVAEAPAPSEFRLSAVIDIAADTHECGLLLRASEDGDTGYIIRLEPSRGRMVFDRWPRKPTGGEQWHISGDVPFDVALERPCTLVPGRHRIDVLVSDDICVVNVDEAVMLSARIYDHTDGRLGFFVSDGEISLVDATLTVRSPSNEDAEEVTDAAALALPN